MALDEKRKSGEWGAIKAAEMSMFDKVGTGIALGVGKEKSSLYFDALGDSAALLDEDVMDGERKAAQVKKDRNKWKGGKAARPPTVNRVF